MSKCSGRHVVKPRMRKREKKKLEEDLGTRTLTRLSI